jgi:glycosyltransferase involved in cell wall biosynthesis
MRVLQIINDLRTGGAETLCGQLSVRLRGHGVDTSVYVLDDKPSPISSALRTASIPLVASRADTALRSPRHIAALTAHLRVERYDIVHVHLYPAQLWTALALRRLPARLRPRLVTTEHNTVNARRALPFFRPIDAWMYGRCDAIVAISDATAQLLAAWTPSIAHRIHTIPNGIDRDRFANAPTLIRPQLGLAEVPADAPLLLCVGRLERQKNQETLLRALPHLPANTHLALVGVGEDEPELRSLTASLNIGPRVHFLGRREDVPELMKVSTLYLQPSLWEGFGLAVAEAMAAGLPVVVSNVSGVREVVGDAGLCVDPRDVSALARAIGSLLADPQLAARLVEKGKLRSYRFTLDRFVAAYVELYEGMLKDEARQWGLSD